ncbi:60S ribosomal protein L33B [Marasmius sp. AFHP31]|nr:60S ribosomal protein L33B [Marasmius sp. AFHP31]
MGSTRLAAGFICLWGLFLEVLAEAVEEQGLDGRFKLYSKGRVLGHKRGKRNTRPNTSLLQIEGVATKEDAQFYLGKRVAFVYKAKREIQGSKVRVIWGRVTRPHGSSGVVKSKFRSNLPPRAFGASVRVMLYPSTI